MRIAVLVKQIPAFAELRLGPNGRLWRDGIEREMNPYCRRAVAQAVELAAAVGDGQVTAFTLGPPVAEEVLREAIAWGEQNAVSTTGVLVSDPKFSGSDTLATAKALAAALTLEGPFDLVLAGLNSVDSDTGQVGPEIAELLDLPFAAGVRYLSVKGATLHLRGEHDDGWAQLKIDLPAVISCAERLIDPCKVDFDRRELVDPGLMKTLSAADLGPGPWGEAASPTQVGETRVHAVNREQVMLTGTIVEQVDQAIAALTRRGALDKKLPPDNSLALAKIPPPRTPNTGLTIGVLVEPDRAELTQELLSAATGLGGLIESDVIALDFSGEKLPLGAWGADSIIDFDSQKIGVLEQDAAKAAAAWGESVNPWAILSPSTTWGREVSGRTAVRLNAGLTSDAVALEVDNGRLVAWKPAFGGQLVAAITTTSPIQMATVRSGVIECLASRAYEAPIEQSNIARVSRVKVLARTRNDDLNVLADAKAVVGVGQGVDPSDYPVLDSLLIALNAPLAATRKVTDAGWLPRSRQIGITGRSIAPRLFVAVGTSGKFNHVVGVRQAQTVLAINIDPQAPIFAQADIGIVGDWREVVPLLAGGLDRSDDDRQGLT
ncbi:MAG: FAD-binding protein [Acidimicrobiia bacterium]|nr:FAD-binding protein [Acidimicrobiia bacterium]